MISPKVKSFQRDVLAACNKIWTLSISWNCKKRTLQVSIRNIINWAWGYVQAVEFPDSWIFCSIENVACEVRSSAKTKTYISTEQAHSKYRLIVVCILWLTWQLSRNWNCSNAYSEYVDNKSQKKRRRTEKVTTDRSRENARVTLVRVVYDKKNSCLLSKFSLLALIPRLSSLDFPFASSPSPSLHFCA